MTKRIAIFGNSHLAAQKFALRDSPDAWPDIDITFVGAHKSQLLETDITDGVLRPTSPAAKRTFQSLNGLREVDLAAFDAVAISGCQITFNLASVLYKDARWLGLPSLAALEDPALMRERLVSVSLFDTCLRREVAKTLGARFATKIRDAAPDLPLYVLSQPRAGERVLLGGKKLSTGHLRIVKKGDGAALSARFDSVVTDMLAQTGITFLPQPDHTRAQHILTAEPFTSEAMRLAREDRHKQPKEDILHANAAYGAVTLTQLQTALTA
ncbi:MAG: hypothetical protein COB65_10785 [Thalassobium sp.]|uniref:hypothetical protein n=1 Tax=Octadecabacter sp. SW4 TaxID=2602067 RepID=UPI000C0EF9F8|nr:hypothetical protein [Octadecabacter sp. SW4]PHQ80838.1 MAG: hypothetical protein COB65_10785 [Thalassobium sp.]QEE36161.1 hypothetical protein FTO60_10850 [Octadecabacter sp. SW4]|tara:strand:- start:2032 stop:2838 length:807 start_codon:yes stop_codon:yes gene_type:complete